MKTFEEALALVVRDAPDANARDAACLYLKDVTARHSEILQEAADSRTLDEFLIVQIMATIEKPYSLAFTCFVSGLIVGIAMEKQEPQG